MLRAAKAIESPATPAEENPKTPKPPKAVERRGIRQNPGGQRGASRAHAGNRQRSARGDRRQREHGKDFDADDRLCAALEEIKRLKAEVDSLKWQLNGAINKGNDAIRRLKSAMAKIEKLEKQAKAAGIAA